MLCYNFKDTLKSHVFIEYFGIYQSGQMNSKFCDFIIYKQPPDVHSNIL